MAEELIVKGENKQERYATLFPQLQTLMSAEDDLIANMANLCACLRDTFHFWWVGFYRVCGEELLLGPFQGPLACTRIAKGRGVCGSAWQQERCIIVPDVEQFPGHIACSSASRSEIVLPLFKDNKILAVLDIDSEYLNHFDETDRYWLEKILALL
ncbi:MAG: GAF domain-containing protein [Bacteroidales bacterium]|nr:GAF domain-containing protein [Bacteroidales bacterium]